MHQQEDPWLWKPLKTAYRYEAPGFWDAIAHFNAAARFMDGVETMLESEASTEADENTIAVATAAAVAYNYVQRAWAQNMDFADMDDEDFAELNEGEDPEAARAASLGFKKTEERLTTLLARRDQALAANPVKAKPMQLARHGNNAAAAGNAAALRYHAERIEDGSLSPKERQGHVVASWVNCENLEHFLGYRPEENQAVQQAQEALDAMWQNYYAIDVLRPYRVTDAARELGESRVTEAHGRLMENREEEVAYLIEDASTSRWLMSYQYQAAIYIKTAQEPYQHPIDRNTAIDHANHLMTVVEEDAHHLSDDDDEVQDIRKALVRQHCTAVQMAEACLHTVSEDRARDLYNMVWNYTQDHGALRAVAQAVTGNQPMAMEKLLEAYTPPMPLLTREQGTKAVNAAKRAGADENALREMCLRLDMDPETQGISSKPAPYRSSLYGLDGIIKWVCMTISEPRQTATEVVKALGGNPHGTGVQETIARYDRYYSD